MQELQRERLGLLLERAIALPPGDRARFIAEASGEDVSFREELTSLVEASAPSSRYFDALADHVGPTLVASLARDPRSFEADAVGIGDVVSHYEILGRIGGGMGVVYRAHDLRLDRPVALKFLPAALATDERARARLYSEARAVSALDHPNIGAVYEISEVDPAGLFIVLAWCDGETLKQVLGRGPLPVSESVALARQVAAALAAAHAAGIIHRDVKPSNIIRSEHGVAKLVDFGIAKAADAEPTRKGWTPGTIAYMSPEQTRGESVDARSDVWSLGVVLYEMLAGRRPFRGEQDATVVLAIRQDEPEPLAKLRSDVPAALATIVETCLAKDPSDRYATADDVLAALAAVEEPSGKEGGEVDGRSPDDARQTARQTWGDGEPRRQRVTGFPSLRRLRHPGGARARAMTMSGLLLLALGAAGGYGVIRDRSPASGAGPVASAEAAVLAVLPFRVSGAGLEEWDEGMVDLLSAGLDGAAGLRAVDGRTVLTRWRRELGDVRDVDLSAALRVARMTGARYAVEGSVTSLGSNVRLVARLHDLASGRRLGAAQIEGSLDSPYALVDHLGFELLRILFEGETGDLPRIDLAAVTTTSVEALHAYLEGERHYREGRWDDAAAAYLRAVALDSTFALAHHRVDLALGWTPGDHGLLQRRHRGIARRLSDRLPERERLLVNGTYRMIRNPSDSTLLENPIEHAVRLYPNDAEAWYLLGEAYYHRSIVKRPAEVEAAFARAIQLDSTFAPYRIHHLEYALHRGDSALAARRFAEYRAVTDPEDPRLRGFELELRFWFVDSLSQAAMMDSLMALPPARVPSIGPPSSAPHMLRTQEFLLRRLLKAIEGPQGAAIDMEAPQVLRDLARNLANQGRLAEAVELLDHPRLVGTESWRCVVAEFNFLEVPVSAAVQRAGMGDPGLATGSQWDAFCGALLATTLGERIPFERGRDRLLATGQTTLARLADAYWGWKQDGERVAAARSLLATNVTFTAHFWTYWMGEIYRELGREQAAEEAYLASLHPQAMFYNYSLAWYRLANIYEALGDGHREREAWERVVAAWENADGALQPRVAKARERLATLR